MIQFNEQLKLGVVGIGYVGLPVCLSFSEIVDTLGYDVSEKKIKYLQQGIDSSLEHDKSKILAAIDSQRKYPLIFSNNVADLADRNVYIVAVPTPVNDSNLPDFNILKSATEIVAKVLKKNDVVIFESTVYPGATREVCLPILESISKLTLNIDFGIGYSPERVSPGDNNSFKDIVKVTSGSNDVVADFVDNLYAKVVNAGTFKVSSIEVAEASKVLENTQRDVNIALMNELSVFFNKMGLNGHEVISAAKTKWNFMAFTPGLVGGHCIGVDPYYLIHKSHQLGNELNLVKSSRAINDKMGFYVADQILLLSARKGIAIVNSKALILGLTYKENSRDIRNSKVIDIYHRLKDYNIQVDVFDPHVEVEEVCAEYNIEVIDKVKHNNYDIIVLAVPHQVFLKTGIEGLKAYAKKQHIFYDVKGIYHQLDIDGHL